MKQIILLLCVHLAFAKAFSQTIIFQESFNNPNLPAEWKIIDGSWQIANLTQKKIKPPGGDNYFALESTGSSEIQINIPIELKVQVNQMELSFNYWVYNNPAGGVVGIDLLDNKGIMLSHILTANLSQKSKWDLFTRRFNVPNNAFYLRLRINALLSPLVSSNIYFKNIQISKRGN